MSRFFKRAMNFNDDDVKFLTSLGYDKEYARFLNSRGITKQNSREYFDDTYFFTHDPFKMTNMSKVVETIKKAVDDGKSFLIYGDYDADGVTATALLYSYLETREANVIRYIPDRLTEGYGLNIAAVEKLAEMGVKLIVTVDNGVSAINEAVRVKELGMELIVTDHHKVGGELPQAYAVVDPHRNDCPSNFKEMSGVGVAFKLACALEGDDGNILIEEYGDLVALGTIGDIVSLTGEN